MSLCKQGTKHLAPVMKERISAMIDVLGTPFGNLFRILKRKQRPNLTLDEIVKDMLRLAREIAEESSDKKIVARARIIIAGFGHEDKDVQKAIEAIFDEGNSPLISQQLLSLVKILVLRGKKDKAWQVVARISSGGLRTKAMLFIACASGDDLDFRRAMSSARYVSSDVLQSKLLIEIMRCRRCKSRRKDVFSLIKSHNSHGLASRIARGVVRVYDFEGAHRLATKIKDTSYRISVLEGIATELSISSLNIG